MINEQGQSDENRIIETKSMPKSEIHNILFYTLLLYRKCRMLNVLQMRLSQLPLLTDM